MIYSVFEWRLSIVYSCRKRSAENNVIITISVTIYLVNLQGDALYGAFVLYLLLNMPYMWLNAIYNPLLVKDPAFNVVFWVGFCLLAFLFFPVEVRQHSIIPEAVDHSFSRQTLSKLKWCNHTGRAVKSRHKRPVGFFFILPSFFTFKATKPHKTPNQTCKTIELNQLFTVEVKGIF